MESAKVFFSPAGMLSVNDMRFEDIAVPEWGENVVVRVRNMTAIQRGVFVERAARLAAKEKTGDAADAAAEAIKQQNKQIEILLVRLCACNEDGTPLFTEEQTSWLEMRSGDVIGRLAEAAQRLSGMTKETKETETKNSAPAATGDSSSG